MRSCCCRARAIPHTCCITRGWRPSDRSVGCFVLYAAGRKGGEVFLRRRFKAAHVDRAFKLYRRFGMLVVLVPALLPPPAPLQDFRAAQRSRRPQPARIRAGRGHRTRRSVLRAGLAGGGYGERAGEFLTRYGGEAVAVLAA